MAQRIVVVTGATGGLGKAILDVFGAAGDNVVAVSRSSGEFSADLTDPAEAERVIKQVIEAHGRVDVLVHAMGGFAGGETLANSSLEVWNRMMKINFYAALYVCRCVVPHMTGARRGRIIAVGSRAGVQPSAGLSAYAVSKAALNTLILTLAAEVRDFGVTANVVLPSTIDTEANRSWGSADEAARWVKPRSIAEVIHWLASDAAADTNGALIPVYGRA